MRPSPTHFRCCLRSSACALLLASAAAWGEGDTYALVPNRELVGSVGTVMARYEQTLTDIARENGLGYEEIIWANRGVDVWLPGEDTVVVLPKQHLLPAAAREGLVVNIAEFRMYYYPPAVRGAARQVITFPISIGRMDWATPIGRWTIVSKQKDPAWYPPESIRQEHLEDGRGELPKIVPPGPDNPLGAYAMRLSVSGYLIHGTNRPVGVGMQVTHGCIRMYPEDIEWLFPQVPVKTPVTILNQPIKFGWAGEELYIEVHPQLGDALPDAIGQMTNATEEYVRATRDRPAAIDWDRVEAALDRADGLPAAVGSAIGIGQGPRAAANRLR